MNGNYLVILVSITIILPLALMKQLGKSGTPWHWGLALWVSCGGMVPAWMCWARRGHIATARVLPTPTSHSPPSPGYLGYASGFSLSCMVFFLISVSTHWHMPVPWGAEHPSRRGVRLGWLLWGQQREQGQRALGAAETLWQGCQATGLFSAEETERCEKGEGEGAGGVSAHVASPRAAASLCPIAHFHRDRLGSSTATGQH